MNLKQCLLPLLLLVGTSYAQEVIATQGNSYENTEGKIDYTIGETVINTVSDDSYTLTQGFHQSEWHFLSVKDYTANFQAIVYPNPVNEMLCIKTAAFEGVLYAVYDPAGKLVLNGKLVEPVTSLNLGEAADGQYLIRLNNEANETLKTFKLQKQ